MIAGSVLIDHRELLRTENRQGISRVEQHGKHFQERRVVTISFFVAGGEKY